MPHIDHTPHRQHVPLPHVMPVGAPLVGALVHAPNPDRAPPPIPVGAPLVGALVHAPNPDRAPPPTPVGAPLVGALVHAPNPDRAPPPTPVGAPLVGALVHAPNPARASRRPILDKERCSSRPFASLRRKRCVLLVNSRIASSVKPQYPDLTPTVPILLLHMIINMPSPRIILPPLQQRIDLLRYTLPEIQYRPVHRPAHHPPLIRRQPAQQPRQ